MSTGIAPSISTTADVRLGVFCAYNSQEVFSAVVHPNQIWTPDPLDIETIHAEAREEFARLVNRATGNTPPPFGKSLLLLGEAGSGKTHLMRAFRSMAHEQGSAYCGYLQMTTRSENYARYVLSNLIDALSWPYYHPHTTTGLGRLAGGLLDALDLAPDQKRRLREDQLEPGELAALVFQFADVAVQDKRFEKIDLDLLRAILFLLSDDARIRSRVLKWLRCEDLARYDREMLGDLVPRPQEHMPLRTVVDLGRLMFAVHGAALVLCVDQLEEMIDQTRHEKDPGELFRRIIDTLVAISSAIPTAIVVVACLEDYFTEARQYLAKPKLDRLAHDPEPVRLGSKRSEEEIGEIIARRLEVLYESADMGPDPENPIFPFRREHLKPLAGMRTRDVLDYCRQHQERCIRAGQWIEPDLPGLLPPPETGKKQILPLEQFWNDFRAGFKMPVLDDEAELARVLAGAIQAVSAEMPDGTYFGTEKDGRFVPVEVHGSGNTVEKLLVAICDRNPQGGGLSRQIEEVARRTGDIPAVIVRSTAFPKTPKSKIAEQIAALIRQGKGRRVVVENADWRCMLAFQEFHQLHQQNPAFADWQRQEQPLSELPGLRQILDLDEKLPLWTTVAAAQHPARMASSPPPPSEAIPKQEPPPQQEKAPVAETGPLLLGKVRSAAAEPIQVEVNWLTRHAAFLGGPGSGKTTAALTLIEQLILRGIPAVLIDRKGDLARYADPAAWEAADNDPARSERRNQLRDRIDVNLFTPGTAQGRTLTLPIVPPDLGNLPEADREQLASYAAAALGSMMGYRPRGIDTKLAILGKAIEVLGGISGAPVTVGRLQSLIAEQDESLLLTVGNFDAKHYKKLAEDLLTLSLQRKRLLEGSGEPLDMDILLGRGAHARPGKTRLSIISTQFLGGPDAVDFWMAQFLIAVGRWASRQPSGGNLQTVFLFDEADQYLPATRQPATKGPMEHLLKRARSAGVGLFLATQSPGDFDYKCRDQILLWLIGQVKQSVAIGKLKPMLEAGKGDAAAKLPGQSVGQFYLVREQSVLPVQTSPSLIATSQLPEDKILKLAQATGTQ